MNQHSKIVTMALTLLALTLGAAAHVASAQSRTPRAVLELFTSQGCAACPPADTLLGEYADTPDIVALTMPTKVWDYLGWADTLATDTLTKRQVAYATALDTSVYTPQMVVNGKAAVVGSDRAAIALAIDSTAHQLRLPIALGAEDGVLTVDVGSADIGAREATLWFGVITKTETVPIGKGENRGRDLVYHNVVRTLRPIGMWKGGEMRLDLPLTDVERRTGAGCVVFAQVDTFKGPGRIVGAAMLEDVFPARKVELPPLAQISR